MRVAISGAWGLLGSALRRALIADESEVVALVRGEGRGVRWDPARGEIDAAGLEGFDAVVHLAGESIFGRWTEAKKERIQRSRVDGTSLLARTLAGLSQKPRVLVSGSAIGYYGDGGDALLDETSPRGEGFLAEVVEAWERAAEPAADSGIRTVWPRTGIVMSKDGGALAQMLTPFKLGLGGKIGKGTQWTSWIGIADWVGAIRHLIASEHAGPINVVSPNPATNSELTQTLAEILHRPAFFSVPAFALEAAFGAEATREMFLVSQRVSADRLLATGFAFRYPGLSAALTA